MRRKVRNHVHGHADTTSDVIAHHPWTAMLYRLTVDEYERIGEMLDDPRVELIDGYLVKKMPKKPEHSWSTKVALKALEDADCRRAGHRGGKNRSGFRP